MNAPVERRRPPSVDALARSLAGTGLPHPILVDIARGGDRCRRRRVGSGACNHVPSHAADARGERHRRVAAHQSGHEHRCSTIRTLSPRPSSSTSQPVPEDHVSERSASCSRGSAVQSPRSSSTTTPPQSCSYSPHWRASRDVPVSRGESVEIGGSFRVPDVMAQSGARLVDVGTTNRTRLDDYRRALDAPGVDAVLVLKVHPSNYRVEGFVEETSVRELATLGVPVVADIGSGLIDATCPWLSGPPPAWLAGEPAARQTIADGASLVTFSGDKLLGGPQSGIIAGRADLVERCQRHPLARAVRPGGLVLAVPAEHRDGLPGQASRDRHRVLADGRSTRCVPARACRDGRCGRGARPSVGGGRTDGLAARCRLGAGGDDGVVRHRTRRRPAGGTAPARPAGDRSVARRSHDARPPIGRPVGRCNDHRRAHCTTPSVVTVVATAGHVDHGKSSLVLALDGYRPRSFRGGEAARSDHRPRLCSHHAAVR